jgi:CheY-like chemotaxis protein
MLELLCVRHEERVMTRCVLAVDDDRQVLNFVARVLRPEFQVVTADDPFEAMALAKKLDHLDLVIADYAMPLMNGDEMVALIRQIWPRVEVLYLTGHPEAELDDDRPAQVCLDKPVTPLLLRTMVAMLLFGDLEPRNNA